MNWAWQQNLSPTPKLVLMALADAANEQGICWPSVSTVAAKCCVSARTVRRVMQKLADRGLIVSEQRYRKDGSCSSNRYRLQLGGGAICHWPLIAETPPPVSGARVPLTPVTYREPP